MEIILDYISRMFAGVPETEETKRLRNDITANMSDKFSELIADGKSNNEAIGTVIAEFGNIDEVLSEMGINRESPEIKKGYTPEAAFVKRLGYPCILFTIGAAVIMMSPLFVDSYMYLNDIVQWIFFAVLTGAVFIGLSFILKRNILASRQEMTENIKTSMKKQAGKRAGFMNIAGTVLEILTVLIFICAAYSYMIGGSSYLYNTDLITLLYLSVNARFLLRIYNREANLIYGRLFKEERKRPTLSFIVREVSQPYMAFCIFISSYVSIHNPMFFLLLYTAAYALFDLLDKLISKRQQNNKENAAPIPDERQSG